MSDVPCRYCKQPIDPDASECPECGDKKMTDRRFKLYLVLWLPIGASIAGFALFSSLLVMAQPLRQYGISPSLLWLPPVIGLAYLGGVYLIRSRRATHRRWINTQRY